MENRQLGAQNPASPTERPTPSSVEETLSCEAPKCTPESLYTTTAPLGAVPLSAYPGLT